jgi:hypothetical protein
MKENIKLAKQGQVDQTNDGIMTNLGKLIKARMII